MSGALVQINTHGAQDAYITQNPSTTFWKAVYKKYTNFTIESLPQLFVGSKDFNRTIEAIIPRNGDLMSKCYIQLTLSGDETDEEHFADYIDNVQFKIANRVIDTHTSDWMTQYMKLTVSKNKRDGLNHMIKNGIGSNSQKRILFIPLFFFFCQSPHLALPLLALQANDVRICVSFKKKDTQRYSIADCKLYIDFVFFEEKERLSLVNNIRDYVVTTIQSVQFPITRIGTSYHTLPFIHAVKELIWFLTKKEERGLSKIKKAEITLNEQKRTMLNNSDYFQIIQPFQHHRGYFSNEYVYCYCFAQDPENSTHYSGSCNFSVVDNVYFNIESENKGELHVYASTINILRIKSGSGYFLFN